MGRSIETSVARVVLRQDQIVEILVKEGVDITLKDAEELIASIRSLASGLKLVMVIHRPHSIQNDARVELLGSPYADALAFISSSAIGTTVYETLLKMNPPPYPVRIFSRQSQAVEWLHSQVVA